MLYVFHGSDTHSAVTKASSLVASLRTKKPDAAFVRLEAENWSPTIIEEHLGGQGLFSNKYIILLVRVTENPEAKEKLPELVSSMNESANIFILAEGKLSAELKKVLEKGADKIVECAFPGSGSSRSQNFDGQGGEKEDFNIFALADAVGQRDPFKSWSIYRQAVDRGLESESIIGTIFWQLKSMALAADGKSADETGLSPFVYSKAKRAVTNYSKTELADLTKKFITLYHEGHRGKVDLELGVERALLAIK